MSRELLFVLPQRRAGGLHRLVETLAPALAGEDIVVRALVPAGADVDRLHEERHVEVHPSDLLQNLPSPRRPLALAAHVVRTRGIARRIADGLPSTPDLVHVFGFTDLLGPAVAHRTDAALVRSANSSIVPPVADGYARAVMARADGSLFEGAGLAGRYRPRRSTAPSAIFYPAAAPADGPAESRRAALGIPDDVMLVGTWSNVTRQKGLTTFARYAAGAAVRRDDVHFLVAGLVPPGHEAYLQRVRDEVAAHPVLAGRFHLAVTGELDRSSVFPTIDVLAQTSRYEGVATSTVEAMVSERPVVAHDVGSVADLVETGVTGHLIRPGDRTAFVEAVSALADDPHERRALGRAGALRASELCTEERLVDAYLGVYRSLVGRAAR